MKRLLPILLLSLFLIPKSSQATHDQGGEIYWDCVGNGKYVFHLNRYARCWPNQPSSMLIEIFGNPLPRDLQNNSVNSFNVYLQTQLYNNGGLDLAPECGIVGSNINCTQNSLVSFTKYIYKSDTIHLSGIPPTSGWRFVASVPCCRPNLTNLIGGGTQTIRAIMYTSQSTFPCFDSSPRFSEIQDYLVCRGSNTTLDFSATDPDADSIRYSFDLSYNSPGVAPQAVQYGPAYSFSNPTPDRSFDSLNIPASLDRYTGKLNLLVNNGSPSNADYLVVVRADSWYNGSIVSSTFQEIALFVIDCPQLPNQLQNVPPRINPPFFKGGPVFSYADTVLVGSQVNVNLSVIDTNRINTAFQNVRIELKGSSLARDLRVNSNCPSPRDSNCAILTSVPQFDTIRSVFYYSASRAWNSIMSWQTDCQDLGPNGTAKTHYFYIKAQDDFCPLPGTNNQVIAITVLPDTVLCPGMITSLVEGNYIEPLQLFPNPSNGKIWMSKSLGGESIVQIYDFSGKLMRQFSLGPNQVEFELPEPNRIYFVRIRMSDGELESFKMIKQ